MSGTEPESHQIYPDTDVQDDPNVVNEGEVGPDE